MRAAKTESGEMPYKNIKLTYDREGIKLDPTKKPIYLPKIVEEFATFLPSHMEKPKYVPDK